MRQKPSLDRVHQLLDYDPATGIFTWKVRLNSRAIVGSRAGNTSPRGYRRIMLDGFMVFEHVLAWFYVHGEWPHLQVDHRDTDKANNRIENLRLATNSQNHINKGLPVNNTSGFKGVCWDSSVGKWRASIKVNGKKKYVGVFDDVELAGAARKIAERKLFGEFAYGGS
jgi:hypothetical protein